MDIIWNILAIYVAIGVAVAALCALGLARTQIEVDILGRRVDAGYAHGALLVMAALLWPLVIWLILVGRKFARTAAQAEQDAADDARRVANFTQRANGV